MPTSKRHHTGSKATSATAEAASALGVLTFRAVRSTYSPEKMYVEVQGDPVCRM